MVSEDFIMLKQSGEFTSFYEKLALLVAPYLDTAWDLADFGCGLALLDFEIASKVKSITAIDIEPKILAEVDNMIDEELYSGNESVGIIETLQADTSNLSEDMRWDVVLFNFYNVPFEELDELISRANRRAIIIVDGKESNMKFHPKSVTRNAYTAPDLEKHFNEKGYKFKKEVVEMQFGYPFKTLGDVQRFLEHYQEEEISNDAALNVDVSSNPEKLLASIEERIIKTNRYDYPYYLPKSVSVGVFVIVI